MTKIVFASTLVLLGSMACSKNEPAAQSPRTGPAVDQTQTTSGAMRGAAPPASFPMRSVGTPVESSISGSGGDETSYDRASTSGSGGVTTGTGGAGSSYPSTNTTG